jgi:hypothetical protein
VFEADQAGASRLSLRVQARLDLRLERLDA